jgi:hypothetical protein
MENTTCSLNGVRPRCLNASPYLPGAAAWLFLFTLCICGLLAGGCSSTKDKPESARFAAVEVVVHNTEKLRSVTADVLHEHGYKAATGSVSTLVFEKQGSSLNNLAYGNWMGTGIWSRVKISFVPVSGDVFRLEAHAFLVRNKGEVLEEEMPVSNIHSGQYQKMLNEIAKRLAPSSS